MSVWKKLNKQDSFVTTYVAKKRWNLSNREVEDFGIKFLPANSSYREINCNFNLVAGMLKLSATVQNCSFRLEVIPTQTPNNTPTGTLALTPTQTPTNTPTSTLALTPTQTPTNTPTSTLECILELQAILD